MTKNEKILTIALLILVVVLIFQGNYDIRSREIITENNRIIAELHKDNKFYTNKIAILQDSMRILKQKDTVIITRYKEKIKYVETFTKPDYIYFYDTLIGTNVAQMDTFICFDSISVQKLTIKLVNCSLDSELLANCYLQNNIYDNIIAVQDSVIILKDSVIEILDDINKEKIKKLRRQRNTFAGSTLLEFLVILGLISK